MAFGITEVIDVQAAVKYHKTVKYRGFLALYVAFRESLCNSVFDVIEVVIAAEISLTRSLFGIVVPIATKKLDDFIGTL